MHKGGKITLGIIVFAVLFTSPWWINLFSGEPKDKPELEYPQGYDQCLRETEYMTAFHMDMLNEWRDIVVREGGRMAEYNGEMYEMSLTKTCFSCHTSKKNFCDKCHEYVSVDPYCWECHVMPDEIDLSEEKTFEKHWEKGDEPDPAAVTGEEEAEDGDEMEVDEEIIKIKTGKKNIEVEIDLEIDGDEVRVKEVEVEKEEEEVK